MASTEAMFCIHCGEEIEADAELCPECGASQNPDELEVRGDSVDITETVNKESSAPFSVPKEVYHNENWKRVKISFAIPYVLMILPIIAAIISPPIPDDATFADMQLMLIAIALFTIGSFAGYIGFTIYTSRDKRVLHDECGQSNKRSPAIITLFFVFTSGFYMFYYLIMRNYRYEIDKSAVE